MGARKHCVAKKHDRPRTEIQLKQFYLNPMTDPLNQGRKCIDNPTLGHKNKDRQIHLA